MGGSLVTRRLGVGDSLATRHLGVGGSPVTRHLGVGDSLVTRHLGVGDRLSWRRAPSVQTYILQKVLRPSEGYHLIILSARALVPSLDVKATPLEDILKPLERIFSSKAAILASAYAAPGATASSVVNELLAHTAALRAAAAPGSAIGGAGGGRAGTWRYAHEKER